MKQFLELGGGLVLTGVIFGIGVLARIVLFGYYGLLGHACKRLDGTKNRTVKYIREELKSRLEKGTGIKSVAVYTENCMGEQKFAGIRIGAWESAGMQTVLLVMLTGAVCSLGGMLWECEGKRILEMMFAAGGSAVILMGMDLVFGVKEKHRRSRICIREHIENFWLAGRGLEESESESTEVHSSKRELKQAAKAEAKEAKEKAREAKKVLKESIRTAKQNKAGKKKCKAQEEKRRLTEELLRERRQLEAKRIAERKKDESVTPEATEETILEQVAEEAAAATTVPACDNSFESLLRNVLAEYLA